MAGQRGLVGRLENLQHRRIAPLGPVSNLRTPKGSRPSGFGSCSKTSRSRAVHKHNPSVAGSPSIQIKLAAQNQSKPLPCNGSQRTRHRPASARQPPKTGDAANQPTQPSSCAIDPFRGPSTPQDWPNRSKTTRERLPATPTNIHALTRCGAGPAAPTPANESA